MRVARPLRLLHRGFARYNSTQPGQITVGTAHLDYEVDADAGFMDITHTFVPPEMRGQGAAKQLCDAAYERARRAPPRAAELLVRERQLRGAQP